MINYDLLFNIINTSLSAISVIFIIFGWVIPYKQSQKQQKDQRHYEESTRFLQYSKNRIDEQISKLYVPLYSLSMENKMQINILLKELNRNYVFAKGETINSLNENDKLLWIDFVKNHFLPNLNRMKDILNNNLHLIFEYELPSSYQRFMKYTLKLNSDLELYLNSSNNDYDTLFVEDNYPSDFDIYINKTLDKLLQLQRNNLTEDSNQSTIVFDTNINNINFGETVLLSKNTNIPFILNISTNEKIVISSYQFVIGTDISCNYKLEDSCVSRKHLIFIKEDNIWYIIDFHSSNGTYLNSKKIRPNSKAVLCNGDIIKIGNTTLCFYIE